jgi:hypothetical protein
MSSSPLERLYDVQHSSAAAKGPETMLHELCSVLQKACFYEYAVTVTCVSWKLLLLPLQAPGATACSSGAAPLCSASPALPARQATQAQPHPTSAVSTATDAKHCTRVW